jgi:hypothetical protein
MRAVPCRVVSGRTYRFEFLFGQSVGFETDFAALRTGAAVRFVASAALKAPVIATTADIAQHIARVLSQRLRMCRNEQSTGHSGQRTGYRAQGTGHRAADSEWTRSESERVRECVRQRLPQRRRVCCNSATDCVLDTDRIAAIKRAADEVDIALSEPAAALELELGLNPYAGQFVVRRHTAHRELELRCCFLRFTELNVRLVHHCDDGVLTAIGCTAHSTAPAHQRSTQRTAHQRSGTQRVSQLSSRRGERASLKETQCVSGNKRAAAKCVCA